MPNGMKVTGLWSVTSGFSIGSLFFVGLLPNLWGQAPTPETPAFEAASIRPSAPTVDQYDAHFSPGTLRYTGITLRLLVRTAYRVQEPQLVGGPPWFSSTRFDVSAKIPGNPNPPEILKMLQRLLEERFHLVVRKETRDQSHYSIVTIRPVWEQHPGMKKATESECVSGSDKSPGTDPMPPCGQVRANKSALRNTFLATSIPMSQFATAFTNSMNAPVENNTGLDGKYDIRLTYADDLPATPLDVVGNPIGKADDPGPSVFSAFQEQLGLKLLSVKGPVEVLVVEHAEMPTEN